MFEKTDAVPLQVLVKKIFFSKVYPHWVAYLQLEFFHLFYSGKNGGSQNTFLTQKHCLS